jgi:putative ABC transport system permease protein
VALIRLALRRLSTEKLPALGYALLVFVTALAFAAAPRALESVSNQALHSELATAGSGERNLRIVERLGGAALPLPSRDSVTEVGQALRDQLPPAIDGLIRHETWVVETPSWQIIEGTSLISILSLRIQADVDEHVRVVEGRAATGQVQYIEDTRPHAPPNQRAVVYEAIMHVKAARQMGIPVGGRLTIEPGAHDPLMLGVNVGAQVVITGLYELVDQASDYWISDTAIAGYRYTPVSPDTNALDTTVLVPLAAYGPLHGNTRGQGMPLRYEWRYYLDTGLLDATRLDTWTGALRRLESNPPRSGLTQVSSETSFQTGLLRLLEQHIAAWHAAEAVLAVAGLGTAVIAGATLAVVTMLASAGRRRAAALVRARGASLGQLGISALAEGLLLAVPGMLLGMLAAAALVPEASAARSAVPAIFVGGLAALCPPLLMLPRREVTAGDQLDERGLRVVRGASARRLIVEATIVAVAIGAAYLLRERGVASQSQSGGTSTAAFAGTDPLIALAPVLAGIAAGIVAGRLYPLVARAVDWLAALRRDLTPVLATRRVTRGASSTPVLLLLVATATMGALAAAVVAHLDRAAVLSGWQQVGADYRLRTAFGPLPPELDGGAALPGVEAAAGLALQQTVSGGRTSWLVVLEPAPFNAVLAGSPLDPALPAELSTSLEAEPLPGLAWSGGGARVGQVVERQVGQQPVQVRIIGLRPHFVGVPVGSDFTVLAAAQFAAAHERLAPRPNNAILRAPSADAQALRAAIDEVAPTLILDSRAQITGAAANAPVMGALRLGVALLAVAALAYAALAVGAALALAGAGRRSEVAHLRALGVGRRQAAWLLFIEYVPAAIVAYVIGVALGIGLFVFIRPGLGLASIVGSTIEVPLAFEPIHLAGLLLAIVAISAVGWALGVAAQRDVDPATAVRGGIA